MTYDEVHSIVRGYEGVYRCYAFTEIYYWFSVDDNDAIRLDLLMMIKVDILRWMAKIQIVAL